MAKKKGGHGKWKKETKGATVLGSDDEALYSDMEQPDPKSNDYYHDAIDDFHAQRDKVLLEDGGSDADTDQEDVLPLDDDDDDSDLDEDADSEDELELIKNVCTRKVQKDEMASDIEDEEEGLPDVKAWGKKKSTYYHTDFVDEDYEGMAESAQELAELEEKEAKALQKKLVEQLNDDDFGLDLFQLPKEESAGTSQKVVKDLSKLPRQEKLKLLSQESPELLDLLEDFKRKMTELKETILPLTELVKQGKITSESAIDYLEMKRGLILQYCTNISFYLVLKAKRVPVSNHPVIRRLVSFRRVLKELEPVDQKLSEEIHIVLDMISKGKEIIPLTIAPKEAAARKRKLRVLKDIQEHAAATEESSTAEQKRVKKKKLTEEEQEIVDLYSASRKKVRFDEDSKDSNSDEQELEEEGTEEEHAEHATEEAGGEDDNNEGEDGEERRGITFQIAKNKGLTIKRKKEYRNPRVRHKMKFRRAKISRKGQVREPRKELQKYGGEMSGIRAGVRRSIKIK